MKKKTQVIILLVSMILFFAQCSATSHKRSFGEVVDDNVIHTKLKTKLIKDKIVNAGQININVWKGVVTLKGTVDNQDQINRSIEMAEKQKGVTEVKAYLVLKEWATPQKVESKHHSSKKKNSFIAKLKTKIQKTDHKKADKTTYGLEEQNVASEDTVKTDSNSKLKTKKVAGKDEYSEFNF